ncbi:AEC family transporter [Candidatus Latescibacterota bacterium]
MFFRLMFASFHGIIEVFLIGIVGYIIVAGLTPGASFLDYLTKIVIRISMPCLIVSNMIKKFNPGEIEYWWIFPLLAVGINISGALLARAYLVFDKSVNFRGEFMALVAFQNGIFLPLAFGPVLFEPDKLPTFLNLLFLYNILSIPLFFTMAIWMINTSSGAGFKLKDAFSPPITATVLSCILVFTGWSVFVPEWVLRPLESLGSLTGPLSMLFIGGIIVTNLPKAKPKDWLEPVKVTGLKCFVFPLTVSLIVFIFRPPEFVALFMIMQSVMPSALLIALVTPNDSISQKSIAGAILISSLTSILTIPLFMGIYGALYG